MRLLLIMSYVISVISLTPLILTTNIQSINISNKLSISCIDDMYDEIKYPLSYKYKYSLLKNNKQIIRNNRRLYKMHLKMLSKVINQENI